MLEHFKGEEIFVKRILDYRDQALNKQRIILTKFIDPHYQRIIKSIVGGNNDLQVISFGGYPGSELQRVIIAPDYFKIVPEDFEIKILKIVYADNFNKISHRDILGALLNLGIKREVFGDIVVGNDYFIVVDEKIKDFLINNLNQIARSRVKLVEWEEEVVNRPNLVRKSFIVSSLRLDKIISSLFKISRATAVKAIQNGDVKVNHKLVEQTSYLCNNSDTISFRHHGRVDLVVLDRMTRSNNHVVEGYFYQ